MALAFSRNRRALRADLPFTEGRRGWRAALSSERSGQGCARPLGRAPCGCRRAPRPGSPRPSMLGWPTGQKPAGEGLSADGVQGRGACDLVWEHVLLSVPLQRGRLPPRKRQQARTRSAVWGQALQQVVGGRGWGGVSAAAAPGSGRPWPWSAGGGGVDGPPDGGGLGQQGGRGGPGGGWAAGWADRGYRR